jgi:hypothetical protein
LNLICRRCYTYRWNISITKSKSQLLQGGAKVTLPKKKMNISIIARSNKLIFLSLIEGCPSFIFTRKRLERTCVKYHYWTQPKIIAFSQIEKKDGGSDELVDDTRCVSIDISSYFSPSALVSFTWIARIRGVKLLLFSK